MKIRFRGFFFVLGGYLLLNPFSISADIEDFTYKSVHRQFKTVEEFYSLYRQNLYHNTDNIHANIFWLEKALKAPFNFPPLALAKIENEKEYQVYRILFHSQLYFLMMEEYLRLAERYEKRHIYFFNTIWSDEIKEGFKIAKIYYNKAFECFKKFEQLSNQAWDKRDFIPTYTLDGEVDHWADRVYRFIHKNQEMNYKKEIQQRLIKLKQKEDQLNNNNITKS